jgi:hypothetical protein
MISGAFDDEDGWSGVASDDGLSDSGNFDGLS